MSEPKPRAKPADTPRPIAAETTTKGPAGPLAVPGAKTMPPSPQTKPGVPAVRALPSPALIVFGLNENRIPQAAWFAASDADVARRAAALMGLRVLAVETDEHKTLAAQLRAGQVHAADRGFAPPVARGLYDKLTALAGPASLTLSSEQTGNNDASTRPASWDAIAPGHIVIAEEDDPDDGWWEAKVMAVEGDRLSLRWLVAPRQACIGRPRSRVALLPPPPAPETLPKAA